MIAEVKGSTCTLRDGVTLAKGSRGAYKITVVLAEEWRELAVTAVFAAFDTVIDVIVTSSGTEISIPHEVLADEDVPVLLGFHGAVQDGTIVRRTVPVLLGKVKESLEPSYEGETEPTPDVVAQILAAAAEAVNIAQGVREDADNGVFDGAQGPEGPKGDPGNAATITIGTTTTGEPGSSASVTNVGTESAAELNFIIPRGAPGQKGEDGDDGISPTATVSKVGNTATITITDANGTTSASVSDGEDGQSGAPGEPGSLIWKTEVAPTEVLGAAQWNISDLDGRDGSTPQEGDLVFYSYYYYEISRVNQSTVIAADPVNIRGPQGEPGGGGSSDYDDLTDKPQINSVPLSGNKSLADLGIEPEAFVVTVTETGGVFSADKTYAQITAAAAAGKRVYATIFGKIFQYDGASGSPLGDVDFSLVDGIGSYKLSLSTGDVWSYSTTTLGTYTKPYSGIPKTDLASDVQDSLLPAVSSADNDKFLCVVNGVWTATTVPSAAGVSF